MTIRAGFIGIDRHSDPRIRDLSGARRDATALWALFSDSVPGIHTVRLIDGDATRTAVLDLLSRTLDAAQDDDVVLLTFAGHGTKDHRLVVADTAFNDIPGTTIDMADLAARFRRSRARAVFCLLDCCFSGGAPARVLEDAPVLRDIGIPIAEIAGQGRVLLAASNIDEPALEDPTTRHGLFTKALIDCLQEMPAPVSLVGIADAVVKHVRAAAARLGRQQTPVMFGHVTGEITFPAIRAGKNFAAAFPELAKASVTADFRDLAGFGIAEPALALWARRFPRGLNALQRDAINEHGVLLGQSLLTVAPTSAGKTFIGEVAAIKVISNGEKAVFLLPYKALVNEKYDEFAALYGEGLGLRVRRCSGDWQDDVAAILRGKYDIAFFTYETFLGLSVASAHLLSQIGLVVLDEAQFITDPRRGIIVELLLTNLVAARQRGIAPQIVTLSAVIGHTNAFERWLGCGLQVATDRPVPLIEGVMDRSGTLHQRAADGQVNLTSLLPAHEIRVRRGEPGSQDMIVPLVRKLIGDGEKVLIFRNTRGAAGGCAEYLARELGLSSAEAALGALSRFDRTSSTEQLARCLAGGTAFHHTDLKREEKTIVENAFREPGGPVRVLVATSTIAAGVNTPASTVIIVETAFHGSDGPTPYSVATYKNMAGRAGRLGFETQGKAITLAENSMERERLFRTYVQGTPEPISSSFDDRAPETWLIRLLAQVERVTRSQAVELLANTYGGFLANMARPGWLAAMEGQLRGLLARMESDGLIEADGEDHIRLTILGRVCGESPLPLSSTMQLIEMLRQIGGTDFTPVTLMALLQALPEQDEDYTPLGRGRTEAGRLGEVAVRFGGHISRALQRRARTDMEYYARCKRALVLLDWTEGVPLQEIERRYSPNPFAHVGHGDIRGFADATRFYLASASRIAAIVHDGEGPTEEAFSTFLRQLDLGLPADALPLTALPVTLERGEYLTLYQDGFRNVDELALRHERVSELLGRARTEDIARLGQRSAA